MIRVFKAGEVSLSEILARTEDKRDVAGTVAAILADVRQNGDAALRRYTKELDHAEPEEIEVPASRWRRRRTISGLSTAVKSAIILLSARKTALSWARRSRPSSGWRCISPAARPPIRPRF